MVSVAFAAVNFIIGIWAYWSVSSYNNVMEDFKDNWEMQPIVDIQTSPSMCPNGYEELIQGKWPGTNAG